MTLILQVALIVSLLGVSVVSARPQNGREEEVGRYISVDCSEEGMKVTLDYHLERHRYTMTSSLSASLEKASLNVGNLPQCLAEKKPELKEHSIFTSYSDCGIEKNSVEHGVNYTGQVVVNLHPIGKPVAGLVFLYSISCTMLNQKLTQVRYNVLENDRQVDTTKEVIPTALNGLFVMDIQPIYRLFSNFAAIYTYPSKCWLSSMDSPSDQVIVIDHGCPVHKGSHLLSSVYQSEALQYTAGSTVVYINMVSDVLPSKHVNLSSTEFRVQFGCDIFFCSGVAAHRIMGIPLCPSAGPCETSLRRQPLLEGGGVETVRALLPVPFAVDLARTGPAAPLTTAVRQPPGYGNRVYTSASLCSDTVPTWSLVVISVVSFFLGGCLVAGIWATRTVTDPLWKVRLPLTTTAVSQVDRPLVSSARAEQNGSLLATDPKPVS